MCRLYRGRRTSLTGMSKDSKLTLRDRWAHWPWLDLLAGVLLAVVTSIFHVNLFPGDSAKIGIYNELGAVLGTTGTLATIAVSTFGHGTSAVMSRVRNARGFELRINFMAILVSPVLAAFGCWGATVLGLRGHNSLASSIVLGIIAWFLLTLLRQSWLIWRLSKIYESGLDDSDVEIKKDPVLRPNPKGQNSFALKHRDNPEGKIRI